MLHEIIERMTYKLFIEPFKKLTAVLFSYFDIAGFLKYLFQIYFTMNLRSY